MTQGLKDYRERYGQIPGNAGNYSSLSFCCLDGLSFSPCRARHSATQFTSLSYLINHVAIGGINTGQTDGPGGGASGEILFLCLGYFCGVRWYCLGRKGRRFKDQRRLPTFVTTTGRKMPLEGGVLPLHHIMAAKNPHNNMGYAVSRVGGPPIMYGLPLKESRRIKLQLHPNPLCKN